MRLPASVTEPLVDEISRPTLSRGELTSAIRMYAIEANLLCETTEKEKQQERADKEKAEKEKETTEKEKTESLKMHGSLSLRGAVGKSK
jgi:hypothetical protein